MTDASLPTMDELKKDFESEKYALARRKADMLLSLDYGNRTIICSAAYEHFMKLANNKNRGRRKAQKLAERFPDCNFQRWLLETRNANSNLNHNFNKEKRRY